MNSPITTSMKESPFSFSERLEGAVPPSLRERRKANHPFYARREVEEKKRGGRRPILITLNQLLHHPFYEREPFLHL